jgi:hypothetical protein
MTQRSDGRYAAQALSRRRRETAVTGKGLIDDFSNPVRASNGQSWRLVSDRVMGGLSSGRMEHVFHHGRPALRLTGDVSLANNGGFLQVNLDLAENGRAFDASAWDGIAITLRGDGGAYAVNLRSTDLDRPWQSYRAFLHSAQSWQCYRLPFESFRPHRTDIALDPRHLRRVGVIAIGEARHVDVALGDLRFFSQAAVR